jgi:hypothetical protein
LYAGPRSTALALSLPGDKSVRFGEHIDIKVITSANGKEGNGNRCPVARSLATFQNM